MSLKKGKLEQLTTRDFILVAHFYNQRAFMGYAYRFSSSWEYCLAFQMKQKAILELASS